MAPDPLIGQHLANFRIDRVLGRGGMGQIYAGYDVKLDRPVAIKVIDTRHRGDPEYAQRFVREARAVARWRHDNIISIYFADDEDGLYYFVMEYIEGADLGEMIARNTRQGVLFDHTEVLRIGQAVASALDYAHHKGVIHRDIKPSNIMIAADGRVILMDFGLALDAQAGSIGEVFGSAHYIAPEQARRSSEAVPQSDLYSLAVIFYQMLTGGVPFDDPSATSVALQHLTLPPPPPRERNPALSQAVEAVLLKALGKQPAGRYPTGAALIAALAEAMQISQPAAAAATPLLGSDDLVGQTIGEYRLESQLGRGGMAHIYRGRDVRLDRAVAIKVIDTPFRQDAAYVVRFKREAQAIAQLEHPNIVRLYHYGDANGLLYMVMEYIEGSNLERLLQRQAETSAGAPAPLPATEALPLIQAVCHALDYAHGKGVIHRDVKPANILIDKQGRAVLADFGLALVTEVGTRGEIFGSPHYVAPEQAISSASVVPQSDLYALGVIIYQMFAGRVPFDGRDPLEIAMQHMTDPPPPPREFQPAMSAELEAVILRMLAKNPAERYPSGAALLAALEHALLADAQISASLVGRSPALAAAAAQQSAATGALATTPAAAALGAPQPGGDTVPSRPPPLIARLPEVLRDWRVLAAGAFGLAALALLIAAIVRNDRPPVLAADSPAAATATSVQATARAGGGGEGQIVVGGVGEGPAGIEPTATIPATPTATIPVTPTVPADLAGAVVVEDALAGSRWSSVQAGYGSMGYVDARYRMSMPAGTNTFWSENPSNAAWPGDLAISINIEPRSGRAGLLFGFRGLTDHYRLLTQADGGFSLERRYGQQIETLASGAGAGTGRLSLILRGSRATVYFGETQLAAVDLPTAPRGEYGLILATPDAAEAYFDTLTVRSLP